MKSLTKILSVLSFIAVGVFAAKEAPGCEHAIILGATYGTTDISNRVAHEYNTGAREFEASTSKWGATFSDGTKHSLTVVYEKCGNLALQTAEEGKVVTLP